MDGGLELSSRSNEVLGYGDWWDGEVVWPEGYEPDANDHDKAEDVLPLTVGGKTVRGRDGDAVVGEKLVPHYDYSVATFRPGQSADARVWLEDYGWSTARTSRPQSK
jgi:hypothetical protein